MFRFKQFDVDQTGCAMKINTDGVLLGAMATAGNPAKILDIGTGTGVIALMLAQRYLSAKIDAVEIDVQAAATAARNFENSRFKMQCSIHPTSIETFFDEHLNETFDLIVSNPPFYINTLESPEAKINVAKHTEVGFFEGLMKDISEYLSRDNGVCWLILPINTAAEVKILAALHRLELQKTILIKSFKESQPHREIVRFGFSGDIEQSAELVIYETPGVYTDAYNNLLKPYFLNF